VSQPYLVTVEHFLSVLFSSDLPLGRLLLLLCIGTMYGHAVCMVSSLLALADTFCQCSSLMGCSHGQCSPARIARAGTCVRCVLRMLSVQASLAWYALPYK